MSKQTPDNKEFRGFYVPNSTQVPDALFDELLSELSGAELKVLLYIIRRTFGFKKAQDNISLRQLVEGITTRQGVVLDRGTGLVKTSVARAVKSLEERGVIVRNKRQNEAGGDEATTYSLKLRTMSQNETPTTLPENDPVFHFDTPPGTKMTHPRVSKSHTQETVKQNTANTVNVNGFETKDASPSDQSHADRTDLRKLPDLDQTKEATQSVAEQILLALGDAHSRAFYYLVAAKVPERVIMQTLSEIKHDGAHSPARVFAHRMKLYAENRLSTYARKAILSSIGDLAQRKHIT